ncbi:hypothetical protein TNCV_3003881 [Trichonephila clavipes]|nr:hypothetical protein TNCV_3003881 [Trichonephila clavipes]
MSPLGVPRLSEWEGTGQTAGVERVTLFGGVKETHSPNSVSCKQQEQGRCKNYSCNFRDRRPPSLSSCFDQQNSIIIERPPYSPYLAP